MSDDGNDSKMEDKSTTGKIEAMSKEELLKLIKLQLLQNKKNQTKTNELTTANTVLCQKQEVLLNELDNERVKYTKLVEEVDQLKKIEITTQSELTILREQLDLLQSQNETLTSTCKTFQEKNSNLQNEVLSVRSSPTIEQQELSTKLIDSQRDIENLNNLKLQLEQTIEQLNIKLKKADQLFQKYILSTVDLLDIFHDNSGNKMELIREPNNVDIFNLYSSELKRIRQTDILYTDLKQSYEQLYMERQQLQQQYDDLKPMSLEQRIEDLEFFNEELKSELMTIKDDYRMKMNAYGQREQEYRRQIEDFEEQFNSLQQEQLQQREQQMIASPSEESRSFSTSSDVLRLESTSSSTINHSDVSDIVHDTLQFIVNFVDLSEKNNSTTNNNNNNNNTSLQSSTLSSSTSSLLLSCDISTLLHSIGITNFTEELYLSNYADVLRLCTLLIERCRVLQYALLRRSHSSDMFSASLESLSIDDQLKSSSLSLFEDSSSSLIDCSSTTKSGYQEYCAIIHRHHNKSLDSIFDLLLDWTTSSTIDTRSLNENWKITISRPNSQNEKSQIRFELSTDAITLSLMPEQYYNGLDALTSETKKLIVENEQQKDEIKLLEKRLSHNESYEHLKTRQTLLEEQLDKQCAQTIELENILKDEFGNKSKYEQIQLSYDELETKYLIAEQLNEQLKTLKEKYDDLVSHLTEKDEQLAKNRCYLIERDEQIKLLTIELQQERSNTVELKQSANELNTLKSEYKEIKQLKANVEHELEQLKDDLNDKDKNKAEEIKQQQFSTDLLEKKKLECNQLIEKVNHYVTDLENVNKSLFEKTKLANELDERLQTMNINYENYKMKYEQTIHEQQKLLDDLNISQNGKQLLIEKIHNYEMKQNNMQDKQTDTNEFKQQEVQLQQAYDEIKQKLQITDEEYLQIVKQAKNEIEQLLLKNNEINEKLSKLEENRLVMETEYRQSIKQITNENIVLQETVENLTKKLNHEVTTPPPPSETSTGENIQELKEKYHKMKLLLTRLKKELQEKNQQPKQSLIDLELADYEKTIKYLKEEIQKKDKEISDFHEELNVRDDKYNGIKSELYNLEQQKQQTEDRANKFKTLLDQAKKELQNAKNVELERTDTDENIRTLLHTNQLELENNKMYISELLQEKQQLLDRINNNTDNSHRTISTLEQNLKIITHDLDIVKQDYETLQDEFNSYKVRAQSVLKQHQQQHTQVENRTTPDRENKIPELEETIEKLKIALKETNEKLQSMMNENDILQKEQDHLIDRQTKIVNEYKKREQELKNQIRKLENECSQRTNENSDMIKNVTAQNEILTAAYKEQIASIQSDHERVLSMIQNQLNLSRADVEILKSRLEYTASRLDSKHSDINSYSSSEPVTTSSNNDNKDDSNWFVHNTERQQGEGMDKELLQTTDGENSTTIAVKTLENVLFNSGDSSSLRHDSLTTIVTSSSTNDKPKHVLFQDAEMELQRINEEYEKCHLRLINTTELLNDSELNNIRLEEQVNLLKDEIRRLERNMERADSISNLEYLKNVILKFFILRTVHERLQLIPVLVTMLKLSPDEQQKLVQVAHNSRFSDENIESNQQQPLPDQQQTGGTSWGTYLGKISGLY